MKQIIFLIFIMLFSSVVYAENWKLAEHIEVTPPDDLDITFQINEAYDLQDKIIMGWTGDELNYMMTVDHQPGGQKTKKYWKGLLSEAKKQSDNNKLDVIHEGDFSNQHGYEITYKIFVYLLDGAPYFNVYYLIKNETHAYYVMAIPIEHKYLQGTWEQTTKIMQSANLIKD